MPFAQVVAAVSAALTLPLLFAESPRTALGDYSVSYLGVGGQSTLTNFATGVDKGFAEVYTPAIETTMFVAPRTEIGFSMNPWISVSQPVTRDGQGREQVSAVAVDLLLRFYPGHLSGTWHPYLEIADGPSYATERVPATGTQFNFLTEIGFGVVVVRRNRWQLQAGYRLVHFSNAGLGAHNPSWNFNGALLGVRWSPPGPERASAAETPLPAGDSRR